MKECENCPHCVKCDGHLVCINKSSDNYDEHIEEITECVFLRLASQLQALRIIQRDSILPRRLKMTAIQSTIQCTTRIGSHEHVESDSICKEAVNHFCICNAWKYRYRADSKGTHDQDMEKADWYINKAMELKGEITND